MEFYCGEEQVSKMIRNGWVIDHLNNSEKYNCRKDNLYIIPRRLNTAKGQTVDHYIENVRIKAAVGFYYLDNNKFQLAIGFNDIVYLYLDDCVKNLASLRFNFNGFEPCFFAAQVFLSWLYGGVSYFNIFWHYATEIIYSEKHQFKLTEEEKRNGERFIYRDGKWYVNLNNKNPNVMRLIHKPAKIHNKFNYAS